MAGEGRRIFVMGHPEYDRITLDGEYKRDMNKGLPIEIPENYYRNDDPSNKPLLTWRAHANNLYSKLAELLCLPGNALRYVRNAVLSWDLRGSEDCSGSRGDLYLYKTFRFYSYFLHGNGV